MQELWISGSMKRPAAQPARGQQKKSKVEASVEASASGSKSDDSGSSSSDSESSQKARLVVCVVRVSFIGCLLFVVDLFPGVT